MTTLVFEWRVYWHYYACMFDTSFVVKAMRKRCATFLAVYSAWVLSTNDTVWYHSLTHSQLSVEQERILFFWFLFFFNDMIVLTVLRCTILPSSLNPLPPFAHAHRQSRPPNIKLLFVERKQTKTKKTVWKHFSPFGRFVECPSPFWMCIISTLSMESFLVLKWFFSKLAQNILHSFLQQILFFLIFKTFATIKN
jgi:hypothetical protein